ncbi:hypothetical protein TNCV_438101 [Trichonephila clavipes]|nr:hypothetical protein TNCV_438101 [Trichonephila clavipes]
MLLLLMPPDRQRPNRGPRNSSWQRAKWRLLFAVALSTIQVGDSTIWLVSTPILREDTRGWSGASHLSTPSTNHTRGLAARRLFRVPPCCKGIIHLQTSMSTPEFKPSLYGTAVSVANHYTGWATKMMLVSLLSDPQLFSDRFLDVGTPEGLSFVRVFDNACSAMPIFNDQRRALTLLGPSASKSLKMSLVAPQMSSSSLDDSSKLRDTSPKALVLLKKATLIYIHSM